MDRARAKEFYGEVGTSKPDATSPITITFKQYDVGRATHLNVYVNGAYVIDMNTHDTNQQGIVDLLRFLVEAGALEKK